jgi:acetate kinase
MGTRCGDIDPALVTYIMRKDKLDIDEMDQMLNKASGLKGISGVSNDMRVLSSRKNAADKRAGLAIDIFVYRIKKYIGAYIAVMGGVDAVVFTAGIGQNQQEIRRKICKDIFSPLKKKPRILVIPTDEELMIGRWAFKLMNPVRKVF